MDAKHEATASRRRSRHGRPSSRSPPCRSRSSRISRHACSIPIGCGLFGALQPWGRDRSGCRVDFSGGGRSSLVRTTRESEPGGCRACQRHGDPRLRARRCPRGIVAPSWRRRVARQSGDRRGGGRFRRTIPDSARRRLRDRPSARRLRRRGSFDQRLSRHRHGRRRRLPPPLRREHCRFRRCSLRMRSRLARRKPRAFTWRDLAR